MSGLYVAIATTTLGFPAAVNCSSLRLTRPQHTPATSSARTVVGVTTAPTLPTYDSAVRVRPLLTPTHRLFEHRGLLQLLVVRDLTVRYKRSLLGVWWTLLNPLLTTAVMFLVFSQIFRFQLPDNEPFSVYLLSGVLIGAFFFQGVIAVGTSMSASAAVLTKVYVPAEVFAVAAGTATAVNFLIGLLPLLVVQLVTGIGIAVSLPLALAVGLSLTLLVTGLGLLVSVAAVRFDDTINLVTVTLTLLTYLTPTFYPKSIVPDKYRLFVELNPLTSYVDTFRTAVYGSDAATWGDWIVILLLGIFALGLGSWRFTRSWPTMAAGL